MQQEYRALRRTVEANRKYDPMVSFQGLEAKGGGNFTTGQTLLRAGVRIIPHDADQQLDILNEILNIPDGLADRNVFDRTTVISNVDIDPTYSPVEVRVITSGSGLSAAEQLQLEQIHGQVDRIIHINTELVPLGNGYQQTPWNNWADAIDDAEAQALLKLEVLADATVDRQIKNFEIIGVDNPTLDLNGQDMSGSFVSRLSITGAMAGNLNATEIAIFNASGLSGIFLTVSAAGTLAVQNNADFLMSRVGPAIAAQPWTLSMTLGGPSVAAVHNITGGVILTNMDNVGDVAHLLFAQGEVTIDSSCVEGEVVIGGTVVINDNSGPNCTVTIIGKEHEIWQMNRLDPDNPPSGLEARPLQLTLSEQLRIVQLRRRGQDDCRKPSYRRTLLRYSSADRSQWPSLGRNVLPRWGSS
jgi:hypothetical protein